MRCVKGLRMPLLDRSEVLARTDLPELATEVCGPSRGQGRGARWHCPSPDHPDAHPSMSLYEGRSGPRWKCHSCGEGGTAVDLLMISTSMSAGDALRELARRAELDVRLSGVTAPRPRVRAHPAAARVNIAPSGPIVPVPRIEQLVDAAAGLLWEPVAAIARRHLHGRGFSELLLRANRVGFDPGPAVLPRADGLPRRAPGIVYPVLDAATGKAVYYQIRYLSPRAASVRKYDSPASEMAANPKLAAIQPVDAPVPGFVAVTEGIPDALTAAQARLRAVAVLGVSHAGTDGASSLARRLVTEHPSPGYIVCFDRDRAGLAAGDRLADGLAQHGVAVARILPPDQGMDLNDWWRAAPDELQAQVAGAAEVLVM
jgi:DNA primase